jgi:D-sedoheptulose 7-phosphate isomerase
MLMLEQRIQQQFFDSADLKVQAAETLTRPIAAAAAAVLGCITAGGKVLLAGHGASLADAQHFAAQFVGRFERDRPGLAAIALGADAATASALAGESGYDLVAAKQVQALGVPGDVLMVLGTDGNSPALHAAAVAAQARDITVIALTGRDGGRLGAVLGETDVHIAVPHDRAARIHEVHALALHCICDAVDLQLIGEQDPA